LSADPRQASGPDDTWTRGSAASFADPAGLAGAIDLYREFRVEGDTWQDWVFTRLRVGPGDRVLDLGAGNGALWTRDGRPRPGLPRLTLVDRSHGMLDACRATFGDGARCVEADLDEWEPPRAAFDRVVAAHVHFFLRDPSALARRAALALAPGGFAAFTTPGDDHLAELRAILDGEFGTGGPLSDPWPARSPARLEETLSTAFPSRTRHDHRGTLLVTRPEPVVGYVRWSRGFHRGRLASESDWTRLHDRVAERVARPGGWRLQTHAVLICAAGGVPSR
jgi:SAM-dependent methyltransferase